MARGNKGTAKKEVGASKWKKIGGGAYRHGNKLIQSGETFFAKKSDLPRGAMDLFELVKEAKKVNNA